MYTDNLVGLKFSEYTRHITARVVHEYGASYTAANEIRNAWLRCIDYSPYAEKFLIRESRLFIAALPRDVPAYIDPAFLEALVKRIADYLSRYTMRAYEPYDNIPDTKKALRRAEKEKLKAMLYDNSAYIQGMYKRRQIQQYKPAKKKNTVILSDDAPTTRTKRPRIVRDAQMKQVTNTFDAMCQVQNMLLVASQMRQKG